MSQIRSRGNAATELRLIQIFNRYRVTGWRRNWKVFGKPDFVFPSSRIAIFVDGEFWHGHPKLGKIPQSNSAFWRKKIERNRLRDQLVNRTLSANGWIVVRIWQHELRRDTLPRRLKRMIHQLIKKKSVAALN
jgi:DNA mismatch endonuclease (patch repair protein)